MSGFNFNTSTPSKPSGGFQFSTGTGNTSAGAGSNFGSGSAATGGQTGTQTSSGGFNFGGATSSSTGNQTASTGFNFGSTGGTAAVPTTGAQSTAQPSSTGFNFGSTQSTGAQNTSTGFNFGTAPSSSSAQTEAKTGTPSASAGFNFGSTTAAAPQTGNSGTQTASSGFNFGATSSATQKGEEASGSNPSAGFQFGNTQGATSGAASGSTPSAGFQFGGTAAASSSAPHADSSKPAEPNVSSGSQQPSGGFQFSTGNTRGQATTGTSGGFQFGSTANASGSKPVEGAATPNTTVLSVQTPQTGQDQPHVLPLNDYLTVNELVYEWQRKLKENILQFGKMTDESNERDIRIRKDADSLLQLEGELKRLELAQRHIDTYIAKIQHGKQSLEDAVVKLETEMNALSDIPLSNRDQKQRADMFDTALSIDSLLYTKSTQVDDLIRKKNEINLAHLEAAPGNIADTLDHVAMNHQKLQEISSIVTELRANIASLDRSLKKSGDSSQHDTRRSLSSSMLQ